MVERVERVEMIEMDEMDEMNGMHEMEEIGETDVENGTVRYKRCIVCQKECSERIKRCKVCKSGRYCSHDCRARHEQDHKEICGHIMQLEEIEAHKRVLSAFSVLGSKSSKG